MKVAGHKGQHADLQDDGQYRELPRSKEQRETAGEGVLSCPGEPPGGPS